jgi:nicotinate-nucleotide adenylyltransferase
MQSRAKGGAPRANDARRLGIFGGTFDPVHYGHLICAEQLREAIGLGLVLFVPSSSPPHKQAPPAASAVHRLEMARLATRDRDCFAVSDIEIQKGGVSYTIDTVRLIRDTYGKDVELWLLMGMDAYLDLPMWKEPEAIVSQCSFGVARRPGYENDLDPRLPTDKTRFVDITSVEISSRYLVPGSVEGYIRQHEPYRSASREQ